jgi:cation diffusion facilitator CzcD-associated flavoprotein CzcO
MENLMVINLFFRTPGPDVIKAKALVVGSRLRSAHDIAAALWENDVTMMQRSNAL